MNYRDSTIPVVIEIKCITELEGFEETSDATEMLRRFSRNFDGATTAAQLAGEASRCILTYTSLSIRVRYSMPT